MRFASLTFDAEYPLALCPPGNAENIFDTPR
jgi:hypothetical protein